MHLQEGEIRVKKGEISAVIDDILWKLKRNERFGTNY